MAKIDVFRFFRDLARNPDQVTALRTHSKADVLMHANRSGYEFTESEFDDAIWGVEVYMAEKLGETFDFSFSLWETMWGKYYLEYLVDDVVGAISDDDIAAFLATSA
jgi:hypothetical protein